MNTQVKKAVINLLLLALIVVPYNGLMAMTKVNLSGSDMHAVSKAMNHAESSALTMFEPVCEHCTKNNCHEKHQCSSGQCFTSPVIMLPVDTGCKPDQSQLNSIEYRVGLIIPPLYAFFRPPR